MIDQPEATKLNGHVPPEAAEETAHPIGGCWRIWSLPTSTPAPGQAGECATERRPCMRGAWTELLIEPPADGQALKRQIQQLLASSSALPSTLDALRIQTYAGRTFDVFTAQPDEIDVPSIAHALGNIARFTGHTRFHYSVAQHSFLMATRVADHVRPYVLIHDMAEALTGGDLPTPYRPLFPLKHVLECYVTRLICQRLGLLWPWPDEIEAAVQLADLRMLATEIAQLLAPAPHAWGALPEPFDITIEAWTPHYAGQVFLTACQDVFNQET